MGTVSIKTGNILEDEAEALVNPVNCVGVMGKGLALEFKKAFPENYRIYKASGMRPGKIMVVQEAGRYIVNFPTKDHWKDPSEYKYIAAGLFDLIGWAKLTGIKSIAIPALGSGLGGLDWNEVKPMILDAFKYMDIQVNLYEPR